MFIIDSDHLAILQRRSGSEYLQLLGRLNRFDRTAFYLTIVSFHEQIGGWQQYIARARDSAGVVRGYRKLEILLTDFADAQVLPFSDSAAEIFDELRRQKIRVATMDLRIASIAIANRMTILTRNSVDFERIPHIAIEDWTLPEKGTSDE
jgi:tRNA(fMet)-specific endonuclease VapC